MYGLLFPLFDENGSLVLKSLDMLEVDKLERPKEADIKVSLFTLTRQALMNS